MHSIAIAITCIAMFFAFVIIASLIPPDDSDRGWRRFDESVDAANRFSLVGRSGGAIPGEMMFGIDVARGRQSVPKTFSVCSSSCVCSSGGMIPYGRYCGFGYTGCGADPCDDADACCKTHDECVTAHGYTDCNCTIAFAKCQACVVRRNVPSACPKKLQASVRMAADVKFILPRCYEAARAESARAWRTKN